MECGKNICILLPHWLVRRWRGGLLFSKREDLLNLREVQSRRAGEAEAGTLVIVLNL